VSKKRALDALRGRQTDMAAWIPYAGVHCAYLLGEAADAYLRDPALVAEGVAHAAETYRADGIPLLFDLSVEAQALGCDVKWWADNVPSIITHPCRDKTPERAGLRLFDQQAGRWPLITQAAALAKPRLGALDCAMLGLVCGPLTLASHLAGVRIFTDCYKNKAFAHAVCSFAADVCAVAASFYVEMGADIIAVVDPVASQVKAPTFAEFVAPNVRPALKVIHDADRTSAFFICGDCTKVIDQVCAIGAHGIAIDEQLNLSYVRDLALKNGIGFAGNLKLTLGLSLGLVSPREDAIVNLAIGGRTGFVMAPGCDMPFDVPAAHVLQVVEARDWFAETYPSYPQREDG
jgi:MtaA/CmuA family methyltransferase